MKTMKAGAVVLLGLVLAAPAWGQSNTEFIRFNVDPSDPLRCEVSFRGGSYRFVTLIELTVDRHPAEINGVPLVERSYHYTYPGEHLPAWQKRLCGRLDWDMVYRAEVHIWHTRSTQSARHSVTYHTPREPETPDTPETPETPETPDTPETPETPDTPDTPETCPAERCDHIAIVPGIPRSIAGDKSGPDHWLRITNPYGKSITFTVTGRDDAGTEFGTYRRELPAYRSVKVLMHDVQAAFDAAAPEGWWTLTVTGSGTLHVLATTKQGEVRVPLPVARPEACGEGARRGGSAGG